MARLKVRSAIAARRWTPDEDALLVRLLEEGTDLAEIARQLNRTFASVQRRASGLRNGRRSREPISRLWTRADDEMLEKLLREGRSTAIIARRMKRTPGAIRHQTWRMQQRRVAARG